MNKKDKIKDAYQNFADDLEKIEKEDEKKRKETLKKGVMEIEQKYRDEIKNTHVVDERIVKLRKEARMQELIGTREKVDKKNFKDKNKYELFLAKELLEVGIEESQKYGGIMTFQELQTLFRKKRPNWVAPQKEIKKAINRLIKAGLIPEKQKMKKAKKILITFKPAQLMPDMITILNLVSGQGYTTQKAIQQILGWKEERIQYILKTMQEEAICYYDKKQQLFYFPVFQ
ncbi:MAG: hypothetical protein U9O98_02160 [Asgard group archaeon]|nr:hypothetical protein [Asgard group archaeon]